MSNLRSGPILAVLMHSALTATANENRTWSQVMQCLQRTDLWFPGAHIIEVDLSRI